MTHIVAAARYFDEAPRSLTYLAIDAEGRPFWTADATAAATMDAETAEITAHDWSDLWASRGDARRACAMEA